MAVVINRKANTITMAASDTLTVAASDNFCMEQIIWYGFTAASDNLVLNINGELYLAYQAGSTAGAIRVPCHHKWLKPGDLLNLATLTTGSFLIMLADT